jgi:outer membrane protein TolC
MEFGWEISQPHGGRGTLKGVVKTYKSAKRPALGALGLVMVAGAMQAQVTVARVEPQGLPPAPSAVVRPLELPRGVVVQRETPGALPLRLDDAIAMGVKNNAAVLIQGQQEQFVRGAVLTAENSLLPNVGFKAYTQAQEIDLVALGFKPSSLAGINLPGFNASSIASIVKVNTTSAQLTLKQPLFDARAFFLYRAAKRVGEATAQNTLNLRGGVALEVGGLYLRALADEAQLRDAQALVKQDEVVYEHARAERDAGVGINLDVIRAQVQLQQEQQAVIRDANAIAKDKIQLNRAMGQPAGQELELVDTVPFAEYTGLSLEDAKALAYTKRKDLLSLEAQLGVAEETGKAIKYQRLPTVGVNGYYGVLGETTGLYHGVFTAVGSVKFPIFEEASLRGEKEVAAAQTIALRRQIESTREQIEADIRTAMLDVQSSAELVKVARSNQVLAGQELDDATARFTAGVDDSLPVVRAQAALEGAQAQVIQAEFQYNFAKLTLARNTGVVETQYGSYLGR